MSYNVKNYTEQGGEKTVIGGEIVIEGKITVADGGEIAGITGDAIGAATASALGGVKAAAKGVDDTVEVKISEDGKLYAPAYPTDATEQAAGLVKMAANVAAIDGETVTTVTVEKFNDLINALITAGLMAPGSSG